MQTPPRTLYEYIQSHASDYQSEAGDLARAIQKDRCFPRPTGREATEKAKPSRASYVECVRHIEEIHGGSPDRLRVLKAAWLSWVERWASIGLSPYGERGRFPPRQNIVEAAIESGLRRGGSGLWFCWNDEPGSPTQGHFRGNREASVALYENDQSFFCHQCGIWGWSDQLKARTWQGKSR